MERRDGCKRHPPEREGVVAHKGLTLPHQEGAILAPALAVVLQQLLGHLPTIAPPPQFAMEPALRTVLLVVVKLLSGGVKGNEGWEQSVT